MVAEVVKEDNVFPMIPGGASIADMLIEPPKTEARQARGECLSMEQAPATQPFHTISLFVNNKPGVLSRVALTFARRAFNIESLVVSPAVEGRYSRMTITSSGSAETLEQVVKQLAKLVDVVHAIDHTGEDAYATEIAMVKIECALNQRDGNPADRRALQGQGRRLRGGLANPAGPRPRARRSMPSSICCAPSGSRSSFARESS